MDAAPSSSPFSLLFQAWLAVRPVISLSLEREGLPASLSPSMGPILFALGRGDGLTIGELASQLGISHVSVVQIVQRLEKARLVARRSCKEDGRATRVWLQPAGHALAPALRRVRRRNLALVRSILGVKDTSRLTGLLEKLVSGLEQASSAPSPRGKPARTPATTGKAAS